MDSHPRSSIRRDDEWGNPYANVKRQMQRIDWNIRGPPSQKPTNYSRHIIDQPCPYLFERERERERERVCVCVYVRERERILKRKVWPFIFAQISAILDQFLRLSAIYWETKAKRRISDVNGDIWLRQTVCKIRPSLFKGKPVLQISNLFFLIHSRQTSKNNFAFAE